MQCHIIVPIFIFLSLTAPAQTLSNTGLTFSPARKKRETGYSSVRGWVESVERMVGRVRRIQGGNI